MLRGVASRLALFVLTLAAFGAIGRFTSRVVLAADATTWVDGGVVTEPYSTRTRGMHEEPHAGVDIGKPSPGQGGGYQTGVPVKAGCVGMVVKVYQFNGTHTKPADALTDLAGGLRNNNTVVIKCTEGEFAGKFIVFLHFSSISVAEGAAVMAATEVGKLGRHGDQSAKSFPPHVHIEVRDMDTDDPKTPRDEGEWDEQDEKRVMTSSKEKSQNPVAPSPKKKGNAAGKSSSRSALRFEYVVSNAPDSEQAIDFFRVRYDSSTPYENVTAPPGWAYQPSDDSDESVTWIATDSSAAIPPGSSLAGFGFDAPNAVPALVRFSIGPDDTGLAPNDLARLRIVGAADSSVVEQGFASSALSMQLVAPSGTETVLLTGSITITVDLASLTDADGDGLQDVDTAIAAMELRGGSTLLGGPVIVRARPAAAHPFQRSRGRIEEPVNADAALFEVPPFTDDGSVTSAVDLFVEIETPGGQRLHGDAPQHVEAILTSLAPGPAEIFTGGAVIPLVDESETPTGVSLGALRVAPNWLTCDLDLDGDVDRDDVRIILAARDMMAAAGDPRDVNGDKMIMIDDARRCAVQCTRPQCAP